MSKIKFIAIPKAASMSVAAMCQSIGIETLWHQRNPYKWQKMVQQIQPDDTTFCIMRDPVERVVSAYNFLASGGAIMHDAMDARRWIKERSLEEFVRESLGKAFTRQMHFRPSSFWLQSLNAERLSFSNLAGDLGAFLAEHGLDAPAQQHINASKYTDLDLSSEAEGLIKDIYADDYTLMP